ncbi:hypothetical protein MRX96_007886 [Rhipicephalus microplus]
MRHPCDPSLAERSKASESRRNSAPEEGEVTAARKGGGSRFTFACETSWWKSAKECARVVKMTAAATRARGRRPSQLAATAAPRQGSADLIVHIRRRRAETSGEEDSASLRQCLTR